MAPMFTNACMMMIRVTPAARSFPKVSGARRAIFIPRHKRNAKSEITIRAPRNPVSSARMAKIESPIGSGRKLNFCTLLPKPRPKNPPEPIAISAWLIWYPAPCGSEPEFKNTEIRSQR